jgi:glycosyltransferase involved in cell wall biosynthesis
VNILHVTDEPWDSGIAHYALTLAGEQFRRGHRVRLWCRPGAPPGAEARRRGLEVRDLERPWLSLAELRRELRSRAIEVINAHTGTGHSLAAAASAGLPVAVVRTRGDARPPEAHALARALARRTTAFIAANTVIRRDLESSFPGSRVELIFQGIASQGAAPEASEPAVGLVGRLDPVKGHDDFIAAASRLPQARFYAAGGGAPERLTALRKAAAGRVEFLGFVPDVSEFMARCRVGVVASTGSEAVSRAAREWMSRGRPLVATRVGCLPDLVEDGRTGILVPPGSPETLAAAVGALLADPAGAREMGSAGRARFERLFSLEKFVASTETLYHDLLDHLPH